MSRALSYRRRTMLATLAAGTGLGVLGGSAAADEHENGAENGNGAEEDTDADADAIHPMFGYPAESLDVEPPVEPDHEVSLRQRGGHAPAVDDAEANGDETETPGADGDENTADADDSDETPGASDDEADAPDGEMEAFPEWFFDPVGLYVEPGETVQFTLESHFHTVTAYHPDMGYEQRVPEGVGPISSPVLWDGSYFLYTFDEPGVYDLICLPHEWAGMVIRVVVGEATGPGAEEVPEPQFVETYPNPDSPLAPDWIAAQVLRDPAMDPENIIEQGSIAWDDLEPESKEFPWEMFTPPEAGGSLISVLSGHQADVETDASGCAHFSPIEGSLTFDLVLEDIDEVTQAHIHEGRRDEEGPVVAPLVEYTEAPDGSGGGDPQSAAPESPLIEGGTVDDTELVENILADPSAYYVNVHTIEHPGGEIRGQIRGREHVDDDPEDPELEDPDDDPDEPESDDDPDEPTPDDND